MSKYRLSNSGIFPVSGCRRVPSFSLHLLVFLCRRVVRHRRVFFSCFRLSTCSQLLSYLLIPFVWSLVGCDSSSSSLSPSYMYCSQLLLSSSIFLCTISRSVVRYGAWFFSGLRLWFNGKHKLIRSYRNTDYQILWHSVTHLMDSSSCVSVPQLVRHRRGSLKIIYR